MIEKMLEKLNTEYPLESLDIGEFSTLKAKGMKFSVRAYEASGLGHISAMRASGFFGLMKMDTLIIVPKEKDLPLFSYDRVLAAGNDSVFVEFYDTTVEPFDASELDKVVAKYSELTDRDCGKHWYESIRLPQSTSKKGKKKQTKAFDALTLDFLSAYLSSPAAEVTDTVEKAKRSEAYANGLLENGGPSTDVFKKELGEEKTARLFRDVLFGTGRE